MSDLGFWRAKVLFVRGREFARLEHLAANGKVMDRHEADVEWRGKV